jgi:hypothetical protein
MAVTDIQRRNALDVRDFGAKGDGIADETTAVRNTFLAQQASGGTIYFPPGEYLFAGLVDMTGATRDLNIEFSPHAKIKRADGQSPVNHRAVFRISNLAGTQIRVNIQGNGCYWDDNARGNPLTDTNGDGTPDDAFEFQHSHAFSIIPRSARGITVIRVEGITFFDPIADCVSFSGGTGETFDSILCSKIESSGRTRVRSDITITASFDRAVISDSILDRLEVEINAIDTSLQHAFSVNNLQIRAFADLYCKGLAAAGITAPLTINNLIVDGGMMLGEWHAEISNSRFHLSSRSRFILGRWRFHGCTFRATASMTSGLLYVDDTADADVMEFHGCRFELAPAVTLDYYLHRLQGTSSVRKLACYDCEFTGQAAVSFFRAGVQIFKGCSFEYAGVNILQGILDINFTANRVELHSNRVLDAAGWLFEPTQDTKAPCDIWMKGNISRTPFQTLKLLRITNVNGRGGTGTSLTFHTLDDHETDASPTSTASYRLKGERHYLVNPAAAGKIGGVCVAAGVPGTWKPFGAIDA